MDDNTKVGDSKVYALWKKFWGEYSIILLFIGIIIIASVLLGGSFLDGNNFRNVLMNNSTIGLLSLGMAFVIISGNIDLSIGSMLVAVGCLTIYSVDYFAKILPSDLVWLAVFLGILVALVSGAIFGTITGLIVTKGRVPSFIITLGFMNIYRSVSMYFMQGGGFFSKTAIFRKISNTELFGVIPLPIIYFVLFAIVAYYISRHTKFGRHVYAVGSNEKAARLSGINTDWVKIVTFIIMGVMVALGTIVEASRMNSINATSSGVGYEITAIAAVVIGGVPMSGGKGNIIGVVFGVLLLGVIGNILDIAGVNVFLINAIKGALVIAAVLLQKKEVIR